MQIICRTIEPNGKLRLVEEAAALAAWRDGQGPFWIDLESDDVGEVVTWLTDFGLDPEILAACQASDSTGHLLPLDEAVFFEYPLATPNPEAAPIVFACLCLDRLVVTMHEERFAAMNHEFLARKVRLRSPTTSDLVCALALVQSQVLRRAVLSLRDKAQDLSSAMDDAPGSVDLADILALKRELLDLDRTTDEQLAVFELLRVLDKPILDLVRLAEFFHPAIGNVQAADRRLERLDRIVVDLQRRHEAAQQEKTNKRLGVLTILSAVFMPLTLIAGIYGMNFDVMPELHYRLAYPLTLGGMAVVAGALYWYFRSRGWLE